MKVLQLAIFALISVSGMEQKVQDIPDRFSTVNDDALMRLLITKNFAKEKEDNIDQKCGCDCTCCQKRNSQYWINREGAYKAAKEYASTHLRLKGDKLNELMQVNFADKWMQFDVLGRGEIEIEQMSSLLKQTMGDMTIPIQ